MARLPAAEREIAAAPQENSGIDRTQLKSQRFPTLREKEVFVRISPIAVAAAVLTLVVAAPALAQQGRPPVTGLPGVTFAPAPPPSGFVFESPSAPKRDVPTPPVQEAEGDTHFDIGFGTDAPISVGGVVSLEVPHRVLFQAGVGFMPHAYAYAIDGVLTAVGVYDQTISQVVRNSLGNSFVLKASTGWRPFENHGFEMLGGYTLMTLGGTSTASDIINTVLIEGGSSQRVPTGLSGAIPLSATLHSFHVTLGWRWLLANDHMVIRASLSYIQVVAAEVGVNLAGLGGTAAASEGAVNQALNGFLSPYFSTYAKAPTLGLSAAYRF